MRIQVLRLIFFLGKEGGEEILDRYYKSLYELISLKEALSSKYIKEYLKLILNSLLSDENNQRSLSILKRVLQSSLISEPPIICCILIITSHVLSKKPGLEKYLYLKFHKEGLETKRDPKYGIEECLIELNLLARHYHPTVTKWASSLIKTGNIEVIEYSGDPLLDFSLVNFLHKFITKNPKSSKKKSEETANEYSGFIDKFSVVNKESESIIKKKKKDKNISLDEYADKVVEDEIDKIDVGNADEDLLFESDNEEIDENEQLEDNEDLEDYEDEDDDNEEVDSKLEEAESFESEEN